MVSSTIKPLFFRSWCETKRGQPLTTFISSYLSERKVCVSTIHSIAWLEGIVQRIYFSIHQYSSGKTEAKNMSIIKYKLYIWCSSKQNTFSHLQNLVFITQYSIVHLVYGCLIVVRSITHLMKMVSSTIKPLFFRSWCDTKRGQPLATFISDFGFLKELLIGSGWKVSMISRPPAWLISLKVTLCEKGHGRMLSNSPRMTTKKRET